MGGKIGAKIEKVTRKDNNVDINTRNNDGDDDSLMGEDDEPVMDEDGFYSNRNPPKNMIEREPEREPDYMEGNISHSMLENEKVGARSI